MRDLPHRLPARGPTDAAAGGRVPGGERTGGPRRNHWNEGVDRPARDHLVRGRPHACAGDGGRASAEWTPGRLMSGSLDVPGMLHDLVQQQTTLGQQQAALLQLQTELVRLQRLLVERAVGVPTTDMTRVMATASIDGVSPANTPEPDEAPNAIGAASAS